MTWNDLVDQAFQDLGVIQPGMTTNGTSLQTTGQLYLNQLISSLSTEELTAFQQIKETFSLQVGVMAYTLGNGGSFNTGVRAQKVTAWRGSFGTILSRGGRILSFSEFDSAAQLLGGEQAAIPAIVGADTAYPLINVRVFPPPSNSPGVIELAFFTPLQQIVDFGQVPQLPDGWSSMLHFGLAVALYAIYARPGQTIDVLAANFQNAKAEVVAQNQMGAPPQQAAQ